MKLMRVASIALAANFVSSADSRECMRRATDFRFSFILVGWSSGTGEASSPLKALIATPSKEKGFGTANRGHYSNAKVDLLLEDALVSVDLNPVYAAPATLDFALSR